MFITGVALRSTPAYDLASPNCDQAARLLQNSVVEVAENWMEIVENGFVDLFS